jgi:dTDP-4-amino-4,6-dideoxygalactose transaminase
MCDVEAAVGMAQLGRYPAIVERRRRHAAAYDRALADVPGIVRPPLVEGATYSHYVARVEHRARVVESLRRAGIDLGQLADYVVPDLPGYEPYAAGDFPNARLASRTVINLPVHAQLTDAERERVVGHLRAAVRAGAPRSAPLGVAAGTAPSR